MYRRHQILIVDDEPIVCERLSASLRRDGHDVVAQTDPAEALRTVESETFDIVICDIRMGEIDGLEVMEQVLAHSPGTKLIMITGYATLELARESLTKGAFDFIAKPFKLGEIRKTIDRAIADLDGEEQPAFTTARQEI
jgi:DNA-binding NtrC family response regulator